MQLLLITLWTGTLVRKRTVFVLQIRVQIKRLNLPHLRYCKIMASDKVEWRIFVREGKVNFGLQKGGGGGGEERGGGERPALGQNTIIDWLIEFVQPTIWQQLLQSILVLGFYELWLHGFFILFIIYKNQTRKLNPWRHISKELRPTEAVAAKWQCREPCG